MLTLVELAKDISARVIDYPLSEAPWYLVGALSTMTHISRWREHLPEDKMPPREIWHHPLELKVWFDEIKAREKQQAPGAGGEDWETIPNSSTLEVDLAAEMAAMRAP